MDTVDGTHYEGTLFQSKFHGQGKMTMKYGTITYTGNFKDGKMDGKDQMVWKEFTRWILSRVIVRGTVQ